VISEKKINKSILIKIKTHKKNLKFIVIKKKIIKYFKNLININKKK
jgi:hypothetical protein